MKPIRNTQDWRNISRLTTLVPGTRKLGEDIADHVKDDDPHHFTLDDHNPAPGVDGDATRVLQHISPKLPQELAILVEYLHLRRISIVALL